MTARTLEEIERDIMRHPSSLEPWKLNPELVRYAADLLAIAQAQREELRKISSERDYYRGELAAAESQNRLEG